ncbi:ferredoxin [Burkholderia sp. H160]|nr:ferredoxin [Burkholderia sp. H160]
MRIALANQVPGILADCGGCLACGTCHGYVDESWVGKLPAPQPDESTMLDGIVGTRAASRLMFQVTP